VNFDDLLARFEDVKPRADSYVARCPAHEDNTPSLALRQTPDGRILLHCFAGCDVTDILASVDARVSDLFPDSEQHSTRGLRRPYPAAAVLTALAHEATIISIAAAQMADGEPLSAEDRERVGIANVRLHEGLRYA
jgi:hypothetical protein|tara:strand:+ start:2623 stop:3030 length:408 start_codon:yes stop_codon:yes gene_type:complete